MIAESRAARVAAVVFGAVALFVSARVGATDLRVTGLARDPRSQQLLYVESHYIHNAGQNGEQRVVLYRCGIDGPAFARKELQYGPTREIPEFTLTDARTGYQEGLRRAERGLRVFQRPANGAPPRDVPIDATGMLVADAGFDAFVRAQWNELEAGRTVRFSFLVPSKLDALPFKISKHAETQIEGVPASVIRLALSGVLGWVVPNIDVTYRKSDRMLLRYEGVTNMRDVKGANLVARIDFPNTERRETTVDLAAVRAEPLTSRCPAMRAN